MPLYLAQRMNLLIAILLLPCLGFALCFTVGKALGNRVGWAAVATTAAGLVLVSLAAATHQPVETFSTTWLRIGSTPFSFSLYYDNAALLMLVLVHFIAVLIQLFSIDYLKPQSDHRRYFGFIQLFILAMLGIILAGSLFQLYFFWELVGLCSYLLIGFWYQKPRAVWAAKKAFLINRIGDAGLLLGIFCVYQQFQTTDFSSFANQGQLTTAGGLLLFCGCVGKSAQWPLSSWLPDAMEGPTPASALIHAATMVAAGIFLLFRIYPLLSPDALVVVAVVGVFTAFWASYSAVYQTDIKKTLAYSTVSQLGLMVLAVGVGAPQAAMFHLCTHAFFKAGLFLGAGSIISSTRSQDTTQMGGLASKLPVTFVCYVLCAGALAGLPLLSGFLSKDSILVAAISWANGYQRWWAYTVPTLALASVGLTAFYVTKQVKMIFFGIARNQSPTLPIVESGWFIKLPLVLLAMLSVGFWFSPNPLQSESNWVVPFLGNNTVGLPMHWVGWVSVITTSVGILSAWRVDYRRFTVVKKSYLDILFDHSLPKYVGFTARFFNQIDVKIIDRAVDYVGISSVILAHIIAWFDRHVVDGLARLSAWAAGFGGNIARSFQNGRIQSYFVVSLMGLVLIIILFLL